MALSAADRKKLEAMDVAGTAAEAVLKRNLKKWSATDVCKWAAETVKAAGYKRIGIALVNIGRNGVSKS